MFSRTAIRSSYFVFRSSSHLLSKKVSLATSLPCPRVPIQKNFFHTTPGQAAAAASTSNVETLQDDAPILGEIPEPPTALDEESFAELTKVLQDSLEYYGLDSYYPSGLLRMGMQYLHVATGLPWWEVIGVGVLIGRLAIFPFTLRNMRSASKMRQHRPEMMELTAKMNDAKKSGDAIGMQMAQFELMQFQKKKGVNVTSTLTNSVPQMIYFMSYFIAIKRMASAPIESFKEGGMLWFVDLTTNDPTWILSALCASSLALTLRTGVDVSTEGMGTMIKNAMQIGLPIFVLFSTHFFPSAVLVYWTTSNLVSLLLALIFRIARIRSALNLPPLPVKEVKVRPGQIIYDENGEPVVVPGRLRKVTTDVKQFFVDRWNNKTRPAPFDADVNRADDQAFRKAGQGPIVATFPYNPREKFADVFANEPKPNRDTFFGRLWHRAYIIFLKKR